MQDSVQILCTSLHFYFAINRLLNGSNKVQLLKQQDKIKEDLKILKLDKKNPNNPVGLKQIKDYIEDNNLPYNIVSKRANN